MIQMENIWDLNVIKYRRDIDRRLKSRSGLSSILNPSLSRN